MEFNIWEEKEEILFLLDGNWGKGDERGGRWEKRALLELAFFVHTASQNPPKSGKFHFDYNGDYETERVLIMSGEATLTPDDGSEEIVIGKGDQVGCLGAWRGGSPSPMVKETNMVSHHIGLFYQEEDLNIWPFHIRFSSTVALPAHGKWPSPWPSTTPTLERWIYVLVIFFPKQKALMFEELF